VTKSSQIAENTRVEPQTRFLVPGEAAEYGRKRTLGNFEQVDGLDLSKGTEQVGTDKMRGTSAVTVIPDFTI